MGKNLNKIATKTAKRWKERAKEDRKNRRNISRAQAFALELMDYMDLHKIKQVDLANKMGVTPQQVNKILRAKANLTFETLDKIADALEVNITSPKIERTSSIHPPFINLYTMQVVHKRKSKIVEENITSQRIIKRNPVLNPSIETMDVYNYTADQI